MYGSLGEAEFEAVAVGFADVEPVVAVAAAPAVRIVGGAVEDAMTTVWMKLCSSTSGRRMFGSTAAVAAVGGAGGVAAPVDDAAGWEKLGMVLGLIGLVVRQAMTHDSNWTPF